MNTDEIIAEAKLLARAGRSDYTAYERLKTKLARAGLTDQAYQCALKQVIDALGL